MTRALALLLALASGCTALVRVDDYTFEEDPCGARPAACEGGRELAFVARSSDVPRLDGAGHRDGYDLDGTDAVICGQTDFTSPGGEPGVDNALAQPFELLEGLGTTGILEMSRQAALTGDQLEIIVLTHVDDLAHDDCIEISRHSGVLPDGVTPADLDVDHDGILDANLVLDYLAAADHDPVGCAIDRVVYGRFPPSTIVAPGMTAEVHVERGRLRMPIGADGSAHDAIVAGSVPVASLVESLPVAVVDFLRPRADLDPSSRSARDCTSLSFGFVLDLVPCTLGTLRTAP